MEAARVANTADAQILGGLWAQAQRELEVERGGSLLVESVFHPERSAAEALLEALADTDRLVVVGTLETVAVGFALARYELAGLTPIGRVEAIYVEPAARQVGVGEAMVDAIIGWCAGRGCHGVDAPALPGSRPAKAFFEDNGFVARLLVMHRPLPGRTADGPDGSVER
jgi:GNAT superfamily N-acetyltransferase